MAIQVEHLTKRYRDQVAVEDVSFAIGDGELVTLLGPSGSGKSTILRLIAGLIPADQGRIEIGGRDATRLSVQQRNIGFVFQQYALFRHMTIEQNVAFGLDVRRWSKQARRQRVQELLAIMQLEGKEKRFPAQLSGGERQRVALARALAPRPDVLLLDEPFGAIDSQVRIELRSWLRRLHDEFHVTSLFVTHDQEEALEISDRIVVLSQGRVEQVGTPREIYEAPATAFVNGFIGPVNLLPSSVRNGSAHAGPIPVPIPDGLAEHAAVTLVVRPNDVTVNLTQNGHSNATVRRVSYLGWGIKLDLVLDGGPPIVAHIPRDRLGTLPLEEGTRAGVELRDVRVYADDYSI
jgi:sulfate/thiosulfate transport system ATP-binding protein